MKNSRDEGVLFFKTKKPYTIAVNGEPQKHHEIICKDINSKCEYAACDIEQLVVKAITNMPQQNFKSTKKQIQLQKLESEKEKGFYENNSPTDEDVEEQSNALMFMVKAAGSPRMSEFLDLFTDFINAGVICCVGDQKMTAPIWKSIAPSDKLMIMFKYLSFFVNPLAQLSDMAQSEENQDLSKVAKD